MLNRCKMPKILTKINGMNYNGWKWTFWQGGWERLRLGKELQFWWHFWVRQVFCGWWREEWPFPWWRGKKERWGQQEWDRSMQRDPRTMEVEDRSYRQESFQPLWDLCRHQESQVWQLAVDFEWLIFICCLLFRLKVEEFIAKSLRFGHWVLNWIC